MIIMNFIRNAKHAYYKKMWVYCIDKMKMCQANDQLWRYWFRLSIRYMKKTLQLK